MKFLLKKAAIVVAMMSSSMIFGMNADLIDLESGENSEEIYTTSRGSLNSVLDRINPVNRERSAWTDFYTVAGGLMGTGITAPVVWHYSSIADHGEINEAMPFVAGAGLFIASMGVCCYFATKGANIFYAACQNLLHRQ